VRRRCPDSPLAESGVHPYILNPHPRPTPHAVLACSCAASFSPTPRRACLVPLTR
jgi:hypothetical protein